MEKWVCGEDVKNYWRVKRISNTFLVVYSVSERKQMDCECMDVCVCRQGCLGASAWTYAHRGRRRASIRGRSYENRGCGFESVRRATPVARAADGSGTVVPREWHDQLTGASVPTKHSLAPVGLISQERESMTLFYLRLRMCTLTHTGACAYI